MYLAICFVIGQVASSIQRTACTSLYTCVSSQTTGSIQRTVCTRLMFCYRSNRKFDPKNSLYPAYVLLSVKQQVRSKEQFAPACMLCFWSSSKFDPKNSFYLPICLRFRSSDKFDPKNSLYLSCTSIPSQVTSSIQRTACTHLFFLYHLVKWPVRSKEQLVPTFRPLVCLPC
jgi:hypothetical protein